MRKPTAIRAATLVAAFVSTFGSAQVFASAENFKGYHLGIDVSQLSTNTTLNGQYVTPYSVTQHGYSHTQDIPMLRLNGKYQWALGENITMAVGATYLLGGYDGGHAVANLPHKLEHSDVYSIYAAPGFAVTDKTLLYTKLAYSANTVRYAKVHKDLSGPTYGLGIQYALSENSYLLGEYTQTRYNDINAEVKNGSERYSHHTSALSVGIGYKF